MTDEDVVARAAALIGVAYSEQSRDGHKTGWQIYTGGKKAKVVMAAVRPHMGLRRTETIDKMLEI
jgi:hypothetical protein